MPVSIPGNLAREIPRGLGNREITAVRPFRAAAQSVARSLKVISDQLGWKVERVAADAPAAAPPTGFRLSEIELGKSGLSSFRTPAVSSWPEIKAMCIAHLDAGKETAKLPHANKIWMLFGFELFTALREQLDADIIEVYPFAIVRALLPTCQHKSTEQGYQDQLAAVSSHVNWEPRKLEAKLKATVAGSRHDRLDAFMAAWVASLPEGRRRTFGDRTQPDDAIWVPRPSDPSSSVVN